MFVDEIEGESEGIGHNKTHSKNCQDGSFACQCSNNCNNLSE
jgi:hypothetical protein